MPEKIRKEREREVHPANGILEWEVGGGFFLAGGRTEDQSLRISTVSVCKLENINTQSWKFSVSRRGVGDDANE